MAAAQIQWSLITDVLDDPETVGRVRTYFDKSLLPGRGFTGARFDDLELVAGDLARTNEFTISDIVAVQMLSVTIPPRAVLTLLEDDGTKDQVAELLNEIGDDRPFWCAERSLFAEGGPALQLDTLLRRIGDIGPVTSSKLIARKRPQLAPVYDSVVFQVAKPNKGTKWWEPLHDVLAANADDIENRLSNLRSLADVSESVSLLRVLDVALWTYGKAARL